MNPDAGISRRRALANRAAQFTRQHVGWPGAAVLLALAVAAALALVVRPLWRQQTQGLLQQHVARLDLTQRLGNAAPGPTRDPRDLARDSLPSVADRGKSVTLLLATLKQSGLEALSGTYAVEDHAPDLVRMKVSIPVKGGYGPLRALVASVLNKLPHAALDSLELDLLADEHQVEGRMQLSLFFRKERP
jgi:hypothetical protein